MKKWSKRRKIFFTSLVLACLYFLLQYSVARIVDGVVEDLFAEGTGCHVEINDVKVSLFFGVSAKTGSASIRCRNETKDQGFTAKSLAIRLQFWKLFLKQIALRDFSIQGVRIHSEGKKSALINTIDFLVRDKEPDPNPKPWHAFISRGWRTDLDEVSIHSDAEGPSPSVLIKAGNFYFALSDVWYRVHEIQRQYPRTKMTARAGDVKVRSEKTRWYGLGAFTAKSDVGQGYIDIFEGTLAKELELSDEGLEFAGKIGVIGDGYFDLTSKGSMLWQQLAKLAPEAKPFILDHHPTLDVQFHMSGPHSEPEFKGRGVITLGTPLPVFKRTECALDTLSSSFHTSIDTLTLNDVEIGELVSGSNLIINYDDNFSYKADLIAEIDRDSDFISRCLSLDNDEGSWFDTTLRNAISNSSNTIRLSGTAIPFTASGELVSNAHRKDARARSQLRARFKADKREIHVTAKERGYFQQVAEVPVVTPDQSSQGSLTPFTTERHSNIDAKVGYSFETNSLEVSKLKIVRYPFRKLLARAAPFIAEESLRSLESITTQETLLSTSLTLKSSNSFSNFTGKGKVDLYDFRVGNLPIKKASLPFRASEKKVLINGAQLSLDAGEVSLKATLPTEGEINATLNIAELNLEKIPTWKTIFPTTPASARGFIDISGSLKHPNYVGELRVEPQLQNTPSIELLSTVKISGDSTQAKVVTSMFGDRLVGQAIYPLGDQTANLEISAEAKDAPLDLFLPEDLKVVDAPTDAITPSLLNASFKFKGPQSDPLSGTGKLKIDKFVLFTEGAKLTHDKPLLATIKNKRLSFANFELLANEKLLSIDGWIDSEIGWNVQMESNWGLGTVFAKAGGLEQLSGDVQLDLALKGQLEDPNLSGRIALSDGTASLPLGNTFIGAEKISITANITSGDLHLDNFHARVGSGFIRGTGLISDVLRGNRRESNINIDLQSISLEPVENLTVRTDGALQISQLPSEPLEVRGDILVDTALYEETIDLRQLIRKTLTFFGGRNDEEISRSTSGQTAPVKLDIRIIAPGNFLVETNIVEAELSSDVKILGTSKAPLASGIVEVTEGFFGFQATRFDIISAHALFSEKDSGIDPELRIIGETAVRTLNGRDHKIQIRIDGRASKPRVKFSSDSGLSENEIVSLLGVGTGSDQFNVFRFSGAEKYDTVEEILDRRNKISTADRIRGLFSFNSISIDSKSDLENNTVIPVVSASRQLTTPATLDLSSELGAKDRNKAFLDYELTPYLSLIAGWQNRSETSTDSSTGAFVAGVKYGAEFPGTSFFPSLRDFSKIEEWR